MDLAAAAEGSFRRLTKMTEVDPALEVEVLIPAYNEAGYIGRTIAALRKLPQVRRILVVDDGSTDGTAAEAAPPGAGFPVARNCGKGRPFSTGLLCPGALLAWSMPIWAIRR